MAVTNMTVEVAAERVLAMAEEEAESNANGAVITLWQGVEDTTWGVVAIYVRLHQDRFVYAYCRDSYRSGIGISRDEAVTHIAERINTKTQTMPDWYEELARS